MFSLVNELTRQRGTSVDGANRHPARVLHLLSARSQGMAVEGRINVRHEDVFTEAVYLLSVDSVDDFEKKKAKVEDPQERDKTTGLRLWSVSVLDPTAQQGRREIKVKIAADV